MKSNLMLIELMDSFRSRRKRKGPWQEKYELLIEDQPMPMIEIIGPKVVYLNKMAKSLMGLLPGKNFDTLKKLFIEEQIAENLLAGERSLPVHLKSDGKNYELVVKKIFSERNFLLEIANKLETEDNPALTSTFTIAAPKALDPADVFDCCFSNMIDGFILVDLQGYFLLANNTFCTMTGYSLEELQKLRFQDITPESSKSFDDQIVIGMLDGKDAFQYEKEYIRKNGELFPIEIQSYRFEQNNQLKGFWGIVRDISREKQTREKLIRSEETYREVFNSSKNAIFLHDYETGKILDINQAVLDIYGYTKKEFLSMPIEKFSEGKPPYSQKEANELLERVKKEKQINFEWKDKRKNGELFWTDNYMKIASIHGKEHIIVISNDITNEKKAKDELLETKLLLETAIDQSPAIILIADAPSGKIRYSNYGSLPLPLFKLKEPPKNIFEKDKLQIKYYASDGTILNENDLPLARAIKKGISSNNVELRLTDNTKIDLWISANAAPIKNNSGKIIAGILIMNNITASKKAELELGQSKLMLESILNTIPVRVFWKDKDLRFLGCNQRFLKDAGLVHIEDILGKTDYDMNWREQAPIYQKDDREIIAKNRLKLNFEEPQTTPDGGTLWLRTSKIPLKNHAGDIIGILGTYDDITQSKNTLFELEKHKKHLESLVAERTNEIARINEELYQKNQELFKSNEYLLKEIEERNIAEQKLKQSEDIFRSFIEQSNEGICLIDDKGIIIEWNNSMSEIFEVSPKKYLNKPVLQFDYDFFPQEKKTEISKQKLTEIIDNYLNNSEPEVLVEEYEKEINKQIKFIQNRIFPIQTTKGKIFGRINLDISARKAAEIELERYKNHLEQLVEERTVALKRNEARIRLVLQSVPLAFYSYNPSDKAKTLWYSEQIESLSGFSMEEIIKNPDFWKSRISKEDYSIVWDSFNSMTFNNPATAEYRWNDAKGQTLWILDKAVLIEETESSTRQIIGCFLDITKRKQAEKAIIENEQNYREIFNSSGDAIFIHNAKTGKVEDVNNTMLSMFNFTYEEALKAGPEKFSLNKSPFDRREALKNIAFAQEKGIHRFEWISRRQDGKLFWTDIILKAITLNSEPKILAVVRDMDEKKKAEEQIKYRNDFEKLIFGISSRFINIPYDNVNQSINITLKEICLFTYTDAGYMFRYTDNNKRTRISNLWQNDKMRLNEKQLHNLEYKVTKWHSDQIFANRVIRIESSDEIPDEAAVLKSIILQQNVKAFIDVPLIYEGNVIGFFGLGSAITGRKWNEDEISLIMATGEIFINALKRKESVENLLESEQSHREIFNATNEAILVINLSTFEIIDVNQAMLNMFGYTYSEALVSFKNLNADYGKYTFKNQASLVSKAVKTGPQVEEWHAKRKDGSLFWVEISLKGAEIKGEKRALAVIRNITERKIAEETLMQNEEKYRLLIEGQTDLVIKLDTDNKFLFVSPSFSDLFGKSEQDLLEEKFLPLVHKDDLDITLKEMQNLYTPPYTCYIELRANTKNGWKWIAWSDKAILDEKNCIKEIVGVGRDITYQKGVEEALRQSEDRFRSIVQHLSDIVLITDEQTKILYDTPSIKNILGYEEGSLLGSLSIDLLHPDDKKAVLEKLHNLISYNNQIETFEMRMKHSDGKWIPLEITIINMLHHPSIKGVVVTLRDISERKLIEKRILDAVIRTEEKERERFAKNLHDDLGPLLSSVKMYINSFSTSDNINKKEYIIKQLNEVVKEAIVTTKEVSNDLSPHILINYGLVSAIESFLKKVPENIKVRFENKLTTTRFSNSIENSAYRIIKELVNNSLKHANASNIIINLDENRYYLMIEFNDDGKGFDIAKLDKMQLKGMGLSNIYSRAKSLNADYDIQTGIGKGFRLLMKIPIVHSME